MKAKEYVAKFTATVDPEQANGAENLRPALLRALKDLSESLLSETEVLIGTRGIKSDPALFSVFREQHIKFRAIARRLNAHYDMSLLKEDGFQTLVKHRMGDEIYNMIPDKTWKVG